MMSLQILVQSVNKILIVIIHTFGPIHTLYQNQFQVD